MRFAIPGCGFETELTENRITVVSIENQALFAKISYDLWMQSKGELGECCLSDDEGSIAFEKKVSCIFNVFDLDANNRKILTKLYKELSDNSKDYYSEYVIGMKASILDTMDRIIESVPYSIIYDENLDIASIFKMLNVHINQMDDDLLSKVCDYIRLESSICNISTYFAVNLKDFFDEDQMKQLYEFLSYSKINMIIIEGHQSNLYPGEKNWIIDKDNCIIEVN